MTDLINAVLHPGIRIKAEVIPSGMSVTKAAQQMGVGRPALSNLLNGNASLSADMAMRLEKAFKTYSREFLLEMQASYDKAQAKQKTPHSNTKAYVLPFLQFKANDIERWVSHNIPARSRFAVFLRTLVHSTGSGLKNVNFPGNDDAERPGWDGFVESSEGTSWIPTGHSGWEFGTTEDPKKKANGDFEKSVKALDAKDRMDVTFVFVTPRRWPGKEKWASGKKAKGLWKDVLAYDSSDLEQWLEQSLSAQAWFANETDAPSEHVRTLEKCWKDWAEVSTPPLTGSLFTYAIEATKEMIRSRLSKPSDGPITITADSTEEALAFVAQLLGERGGGEELAEYRDRVLVFEKPDVLPRLAKGTTTFIPVVFTREVERQLAPYAKSMHAIIVYPRNAMISKPDIVLEPADYATFNKALEEMGKDRDTIVRLANESGRSLTVLRRRLAIVDAVRIPIWADAKTALSLVPFLFVGAWQWTNDTDRQGLSLLAGDRPFDELEKDFLIVAQLDETPVWRVGDYCGVISKIDLLYATKGFVTPDDLKRYFAIARMVLGEDNPALDLDEDQRWLAAIYGKRREFSPAFREGISETLVLLAVHGGELFKKQLGIDPEAEARMVVRDLLTPLTMRKLEANDRDLPTYAEAAPDEFLSILERDLTTGARACLGLMRPAGSAFGHSPSRTGLLWSLEGLAWSPETIARAVFILADLAQVEINDNWINKPSHSLKAIFRAWMPQTAASHEARVDLMKKLAVKFPDVAWRICVSQFGPHDGMGDYSHKPRWRPDGFGFGEPFRTWEPIRKFQREMVEMALNWKDYTLSKLTDLIERLRGLDDGYRIRVWELIETWANTMASDADRAAIREKIRVCVLSRSAASTAKTNAGVTGLTDEAKAAYARLEPSDPINKHAWLFRDSWVEVSADEVEEYDNIDFQERRERVQNLRVDAVREIQAQHGLSGLLDLAERGNASREIGGYAAHFVLSEAEIVEFLRLALQPVFEIKETAFSAKNVIAGALWAIPDRDMRDRILNAFALELSEIDFVQLLMLAPFGKDTWKLVDVLGEAAQSKYWSDVVPNRIPDSDTENYEGVERLLKAKRPRAAFSCVRYQPEKFDANVLFRLLSAIAAGGNEKSGEYKFEHYEIEQAFKHLNTSPTLAVDQKAGLEFAFLQVLARSWGNDGYGIPNLERFLEAHPEAFVQAIAWAFKRNDGAMDPPEFQLPLDDVEKKAERGYKLLKAIKRIPGQDLGELQGPGQDAGDLRAVGLADWIHKVRQASAELSRSEIAELCIGELLANAPIGKDGIWPCEPVRQVMEDERSESIMRGASIGVYNLRGVHHRGEAGDEERQLAEKYRQWGRLLQSSHPYVSSKLLMELARMYDREADREDNEAGIRRRLR